MRTNSCKKEWGVKVEKVRIIKEIAKKIYYNFDVIKVSKIIYQLEGVTTKRKLRKIFINIEKSSPYGLDVDDIVLTFFNEISDKNIDEPIDILILYLYEYIKTSDINYEFSYQKM